MFPNIPWSRSSHSPPINLLMVRSNLSARKSGIHQVHMHHKESTRCILLMRMRLETASLVLRLAWIMELRLAWKGKLELNCRHDVIHAETFMNGLTMLTAKLAHGLTNALSISLENSNIVMLLECAFHTNKTIQDLVAKVKSLTTLVEERLGVSFMRSPGTPHQSRLCFCHEFIIPAETKISLARNESSQHHRAASSTWCDDALTYFYSIFESSTYHGNDQKDTKK